METQTKSPQTLLEAIRYFSDPDVCLETVKNLRWAGGVVCPHCGTKAEHYFIKTRRIWRCKNKECGKQFSVKVGTIFEDSALGLDKWLVAIWLIANAKNGISSHEVARSLGITQKSAWHMMHRIRLAMQTGTFKKLSGDVEVDETYIGGKARNMHKGKREAKGRGTVGKTPVMGLLERHSENGHSTVRTEVVPDIKAETLQGKVKEYVEKGSDVYTDTLASYEGLNADFAHQMINHAEAYVNGQVHTNGLENFWSLTKRCIKGTYVSIAPFHTFRYLDEEAFRFNNRKVKDSDRFTKMLQSISGKRLTYRKLTGKV